ncbi:hypothetical protein C8Z91_02185 [Paenibacillus elgii]|uniref:Tissue inhibitor of metalloproteinase n=1 Tax=Paenibacillus elgii TaxID=189691 RepID=A0A2T6G931_9BACL|nr:hypothetical protein [Paenibacillus elgii]PUA40659.1 hypothetical protein C8Z91_02185 [Paenibacillus elgii]
MKRYLINALSLLVLFCCISSIFPTKSYACSCAYKPDPDKALEQAKAVFSGKVLEAKQEIFDVDGILEYREAILFNVEQTWKGTSQTQIIVNTNFGGESSCGNEYKVGQTYLVFANNYDSNNTLHTSICSLTKEFSNANMELNKIGEGSKPIENVNLKGTMSKLDFNNKLVYVTAAYHRLIKYHLVEVFFGVFIVVIGIVLVFKKKKVNCNK